VSVDTSLTAGPTLRYDVLVRARVRTGPRDPCRWWPHQPDFV